MQEVIRKQLLITLSGDYGAEKLIPGKYFIHRHCATHSNFFIISGFCSSFMRGFRSSKPDIVAVDFSVNVRKELIRIHNAVFKRLISLNIFPAAIC